MRSDIIKKYAFILLIIVLIIFFTFKFSKLEENREGNIINLIMDNKVTQVTKILNNPNNNIESGLYKFISDSLVIISNIEEIDCVEFFENFDIKKYKEKTKEIETLIDKQFDYYDDIDNLYNNKNIYYIGKNTKKYDKLVYIYKNNILNYYKNILDRNISNLEASNEALNYLYKNKNSWFYKDNDIIFKNEEKALEFQDIVAILDED